MIREGRRNTNIQASVLTGLIVVVVIAIIIVIIMMVEAWLGTIVAPVVSGLILAASMIHPK